MRRQFGRYVIADDSRDEIGRGAFGRVYRAFDPNVDRHVALKVLSSGSDPDMLSRFQEESKTAGKLKHENIVKVYDFDLQDGMPYLVMELLDGVTLESVIRSRMFFGRPVQMLDEVEIMFQVASGLQYAHAQNVIHRDIKPGNIMVLPNGTAKVMDFGIARMMDKGGTRLTRQGDIAGTILYMAPEQFTGCDADKRTDIFAYADVYYELLTGTHPFYATDPGSVMYRITAHEPPPIREHLPECPALLEAMIQRLLAKDPEIRPDKMEEVLFDTQPILQTLRQEQAAVLVAGIPALIEGGDQESARQAIRQVLVLDPLNIVARGLGDRLQEENRRRAIRARLQALTRQGEEHLAARRFGDAVQCFESARALDRSDASLQARLDEVKLTAENVRHAARLMSEARAELLQGHPEAALDRCEQASGLDPGIQGCDQLRGDARKLIEDRRDAAALVRAEQLREREQYDEALVILDAIQEGSSAKAQALARRELVDRERAQAALRRRRQLFEAALSDARSQLEARRLDEALTSAEALCAQYSGEPESGEFLSEVREHLAARGRAETVGKITQAARGFVKAERFSDARSVIEEGLHSYPGDTSLVRLLQVASALAAAQERAAQINDLVEQTHGLAAERRLDEAQLLIDRAIATYGNEIALVERKRDLELERARAEYAENLAKTLDSARQLLAGQTPGDAVELLEEAQFRFAGEKDLAALLAEARTARAAAEERDFASRSLSEAATLERLEQYEAAVSVVEAALSHYPSNPDLLNAAERLRQSLREQELRRMLASRIGRIEDAIQSTDWDRATAESAEATRSFPDAQALSQYPSRIQLGRRQTEIKRLRMRVEERLKRQDLDGAERELAAFREDFSGETEWQDLQRGCQSLRKELQEQERRLMLASRISRIEAAVRAADWERADAESAEAARMFPDEPALAQFPIKILAGRRQTELSLLKTRVEASIKRQDLDGAERELAVSHAEFSRETGWQELQRKCQQLREYLTGLSAAESAFGQQDYAVAESILQLLLAKAIDQRARKLLGEVNEARRLAEQEARRLEEARLRRQAEEARLDRERAAVARGRAEAAELSQKADYMAAIALLERLSARYPAYEDLRRDLDAAKGELERQQREAEAQARRLREQAIGTRRKQAAGLFKQGELKAAIALLDRAAAEFPEVVEIRSDRQALAEELERQRREAEAEASRLREQAIAERREQAAELSKEGDLNAAIALLDRTAAEFPDVVEIRSDRQALAEDLERQRREAEAEALRLRKLAVAAQRKQAAELVEKGETQAAIALLDRAAAEFPDATEIRADRQALIGELEETRRRAQELAQRQREEAIATGRNQAADSMRSGDSQGALEALGQLGLKFPDSVEIRQDLEALLREMDRQRLVAEQEALRQRELLIAARRAEAAGLLRNRDAAGALALLEQLQAEFPDVAEIVRDKKAALKEERRLRREAEQEARRELVRVAIAEGRAQAEELIRQQRYVEAAALLDRLVGEYPGNTEIRTDRELARRETERQLRAAEEQERQRREQAIAARRQAASQALRNGDSQGAIAILDQLWAEYPDVDEIRRDRAAALDDLERRRREAEDAARRERERVLIAEGRAQASILVREGGYQRAIALLDRLAAKYPGDPDIRIDRDAAWRKLEAQRRQAEEQARLQRERAAIGEGRTEAAGFVQSGNHQAALAILERLSLQFPGNAEIECERNSAAEAVERQHSEAEARARKALASLSVHRIEPMETASGTGRIVGTQAKRRHSQDVRATGGRPASFSARNSAGSQRNATQTQADATTGERSTGGESSGSRTSGGSLSTLRDGATALKPAIGSMLSRLSILSGQAIVSVRNHIAAFLGKGDRTVIVPLLDDCAASVLAWIARRHPENLAMQTARDEMMRRPGRSAANRERLVALAAGFACILFVCAFFACRPASSRPQTSHQPTKSTQTTPVTPAR